jgi:hypothetical protein
VGGQSRVEDASVHNEEKRNMRKRREDKILPQLPQREGLRRKLR